MKIKAYDFERILELFEEGEWSELHIDIGGMHLFLSRDPNARLVNGLDQPAPNPVAQRTVQNDSGTGLADALEEVGTGDGGESPVSDKWTAVTAPNLGTFYRSPKPDAPPYVEIGDSVEANTEICLIEVMKLFTTLKAGVKGTVRQICVEDGAMVEAGETLFYIEQE